MNLQQAREEGFLKYASKLIWMSCTLFPLTGSLQCRTCSFSGDLELKKKVFRIPQKALEILQMDKLTDLPKENG